MRHLKLFAPCSYVYNGMNGMNIIVYFIAGCWPGPSQSQSDGWSFSTPKLAGHLAKDQKISKLGLYFHVLYSTLLFHGTCFVSLCRNNQLPIMLMQSAVAKALDNKLQLTLDPVVPKHSEVTLAELIVLYIATRETLDEPSKHSWYRCQAASCRKSQLELLFLEQHPTTLHGCYYSGW